MSEWKSMKQLHLEPHASVLLSVQMAGRRVVGEAYWIPDEDRDEGAWWWANTSPGDYYAERITDPITHWMPLPEPPK